MVCSVLILSGCALADKLGFDTYDYMSEAVTTTHESDSETAVILEEFLDILITDSIMLPEFDNMNDAIDLYRDAVLTYMLDTGYSKYSGNTALIEKASTEYPSYNITQLIPEREFESTMYRCFGGNVMITHKDSARFKYLPKVGAYISPVTPVSGGLYGEINTLYETEKTYRVWFTVLGEGLVSDEYFALIIKRDDGTLYVKKLLDGSEVGK